jgi:S-DNA-T family DNA segregation ATPase FtsK/SpoIIIE
LPDWPIEPKPFKTGWVSLGPFLRTWLFTGFGLASLFVRLFFLTGLFMVVGISSKKLKGHLVSGFICLNHHIYFIWFFCYLIAWIRRYCRLWVEFVLQDYIGKTGTLLVLLLD